jgi:hypothetical protein
MPKSGNTDRGDVASSSRSREAQQFGKAASAEPSQLVYFHLGCPVTANARCVPLLDLEASNVLSVEVEEHRPHRRSTDV